MRTTLLPVAASHSRRIQEAASVSHGFRIVSLFLFLMLSFPVVFAQHIVGSIAVGDEPRGVAVNPFTDLVYVANVQSGTVSVLHKNALVATVPVDTLPFVVAINSLTNLVYAAGCNFLTGAGSMVVVIDGHTHKVLKDIVLNQSCSLGTQGIAVNPLTNRVYVSDYDDSQEVVIDGATNQIAGRISLAGGLPLGVDVDLSANQVWVALDGPEAQVDILDGATDTVLDTVTVTSGNIFIEGVAIDSITHRAYISSISSPANLYVLGTRHRNLIATVPIGQFANSVTVDVLSNLIFVTDGQANTVVGVDGSDNQVKSTVPLNGTFPSGVTANPVTRLVYVTEFDSGQVEVMTEH
jgi:DNA-binding beta-propeller fold protein YncE